MNNIVSQKEALRLADSAQPKVRAKQLERCIDKTNNVIRVSADSGEYRTSVSIDYYEFKGANKYRLEYLAKELSDLLYKAGYQVNYYKTSAGYNVDIIFGSGEYVDE